MEVSCVKLNRKSLWVGTAGCSYQTPDKSDHPGGDQAPLEAAVEGPSNVAVGVFFALRLEQVLLENTVDAIGLVSLRLFRHRKRLSQLL